MKLLQRLSILPIAFAAGAVLTGCPDTGGFSSLDGSASWDGLSESEREQLLCDDLEAYYESEISDDELERAACIIGASVAGATDYALNGDEATATTACQTAYDDCLADDGEGEEGGEDTCDGTGYDAACTFTVDQLQACADETVDGFKELAAQTCDSIDWAAEPEEPTEDGACKTVTDSCG